MIGKEDILFEISDVGGDMFVITGRFASIKCDILAHVNGQITEEMIEYYRDVVANDVLVRYKREILGEDVDMLTMSDVIMGPHPMNTFTIMRNINQNEREGF